MKNLTNKIISCVLAIVTAFTMCVSVKKLSPLTVQAATGEEFLSEVALIYEDNLDDAKEKIEGTGWKILEKDLNATAEIVFQDGVYLIYKTSTNVEDAITDLRVMDMYGGFSSSNYERELEKSRSQYLELIKELRVAAAEFKKKYNDGDEMAKLAYRQMNYYQDVKTENGTETDMLMGDFFLNLPSDDKIVQMLFEGNSIIVTNLISMLAVGLSGQNSETLADKIKQMYEIKDTLTHEEYYDDAKIIYTALENIRAKLIRYNTLSDEYNLTDEEMLEEEFEFMSSYAAVAILLEKIPYGETTLAKFVSAGGWATEDLYPIVAALSVGQRALIRMGQLEAVLKYNSPSKPIEELNEVLDGLEAELTDENGEFQVIDVYLGVDRSIFKGSFAMTTAAERQQALTGKTWDLDSANAASKGFYTASYVFAGIDAVIAGVELGFLIKWAVLKHASTKLYSQWAAAEVKDAFLFSQSIQADQAVDWFIAKWVPVAKTLAVVAAAAAFIAAGLSGISTWYNYYNPDYTEIPNVIVDVRETDAGDKYIKYTAAKVFGDDENKNADFNAFVGREWNALYYTKDANAGNCLTPNFVYRENNSTVSKRHQGVSMFGESNAFNLNSNVYSKSAKGIYLSVRYSLAKKAAADIPTVVGSMVSASIYVLCVFGGIGIGAGGVVLWKKFGKKKEEVAEEATEASETEE